MAPALRAPIDRGGAGQLDLADPYVRPAFRGRGIARELLGALDREAIGLGAGVTRLDTGAKQSQAQGLYERSGYREIGNWNDNAQAAYWGEERLR